MTAQPPQAQPPPEAIRREIDLALAELAELAASHPTPIDYYDTLLERAAGVTGAAGGCVWVAVVGGAHRCLRRWGSAYSTADAAAVASWLRAGQPSTWRSVVASRVTVGEDLWGVISLDFAIPPPPAARPGLQRFLDRLAAGASDYQSRRELRRAGEDRRVVAELQSLTLAVHRPWSVRHVLAAVATEGRRLVGCDRVAVGLRRPGITGAHGVGVRVGAVSGAATLNRRSAELQALQALAAAVLRSGEPFFYEEPTGERPFADEQPPQIARPLCRYLDESAARRLAIVPLSPIGSRGEVPPGVPAPAVLITEQMGNAPLDATCRRLWMLADHAAVAIDRATRLGRLPVVGRMLAAPPLRQWLTRRWLPRSAAAVVLLAGLAAALLLVETDYSVRVTGRLSPAVQRHIFAPTDGVLTELHVEHGQRVAAGELLATLRSPEVEVELTRVRGALATARQQRDAAEAAQIDAQSGRGSPRTPGELAAAVQESKQAVAALRAELALLEAEQRRLRITSPISGSVITFDLRGLRAAPPVARGQPLLTVADLEGGWRARFQAPDRHAAPILDTRRESPDGVAVRFVTASRPDRQRRATATRFRLSTEPDPLDGASRLAFEAALPPGALEDPRPGADLVGRVECGRRSLAYAWLGDLYHELRRWWF